MPITCVDKQLRDNAFVGSLIRHKLVAHITKTFFIHKLLRNRIIIPLKIFVQIYETKMISYKIYYSNLTKICLGQLATNLVEILRLNGTFNASNNTPICTKL